MSHVILITMIFIFNCFFSTSAMAKKKKAPIEAPESVQQKICVEINNNSKVDLNAFAKTNCKKKPLEFLLSLADEARKTPKETQLDKLKILKTSIRDLKKSIISSGEFPHQDIKLDLSNNLKELSGFAKDTKGEFIWAIGDKDETVVKIGINLKTIEKFTVSGIINKNWEALTFDNDGMLWILDIGDNKNNRKHVEFHKINPIAAKDNILMVERTYKVTYPEKQLDVEAGFFHNNRIYLVERDNFEAVRFFYAPLPKKNDNSTDIKALNFGMIPTGSSITDAAITEDGRLYFLTFFDIEEVQNWQDINKRKLRLVKKIFLGQQEALGITGPNEFIVGTEAGSIYQVKEN